MFTVKFKAKVIFSKISDTGSDFHEDQGFIK